MADPSIPDTASPQRRLTAILAADIAGYSALMSANEEATVRALKEQQTAILPMIANHAGRVIDTAGDGIMAEFASVLNAVKCALAIQDTMQRRNAAADPARAMRYRIGINIGDVVFDEARIYGDGINIAARLEGLATPGGICITAKVQDEISGKLDVDLEDLGEQQLKNIPKPVRVYRVTAPSRTEDVLARLGKQPALPNRPSLAVLPFTNMSGDPEQEYFADGMTEDIITALSRVKWFFVIARNSSFTYKGRAVDIRQVGRELGVRYVLEGSVRKAGQRVRVTGQLIEAATARHIWADKYDSDLDDIFELQDRITETIVGIIEPSLYSAEISLARAKPTESLNAYDLYLRALPHHYAMTRESYPQALELLHRAIEIDPDFSLAKAFLSFSYITRVAIGWSSPDDARRGIALAREALADNRDDPNTLYRAALTLGFGAHDYDTALPAIDRALMLNSNSAGVLNAAGWIYYYVKQPEKAIEYFVRGIRLSPRDMDMGYSLSGLAFAYILAGKNSEAEDCAARAIKEMPNWASGHRARIFALMRLGRVADARQAVADYLNRWPEATIRQLTALWPVKDATLRDEYGEALRGAGLRE